MKSPAECITLLIELSVTCDLCPGLVTCVLRFVPADTGTMAVDQAHFPLESDEEMAETNDTPRSKKKKKKALDQPKHGWQQAHIGRML